MPFVDFDGVKNFIFPGLHATLLSLAQFQTYEEAAAIIIRDRAGVVIPDDIADSPDWVNVPAAYIIQKQASARIVKKGEELVDEINDNYEIALKILDEKRVKGSPTEMVYALQAALTGVNE